MHLVLGNLYIARSMKRILILSLKLNKYNRLDWWDYWAICGLLIVLCSCLIQINLAMLKKNCHVNQFVTLPQVIC